MGVVTGTVKSYDPQTGEGLIVLDGNAEQVLLDRRVSGGVRLSVGVKVALQMIHRPAGAYASCVRLL